MLFLKAELKNQTKVRILECIFITENNVNKANIKGFSTVIFILRIFDRHKLCRKHMDSNHKRVSTSDNF